LNAMGYAIGPRTQLKRIEELLRKKYYDPR
jgi:hypothetical protein